MAGILIPLGYILDLILGDPRSIPHPVVIMGRIIKGLERVLYNPTKSPRNLMLQGVILTAIVVLLTYGFFIGLNFVLKDYPLLWWSVNIWFAGTLLASRSLAQAGYEVYNPLSKGDLQGARKALSMIVSRDCEEISSQDIARGAVETVAENTSDGVIAPLFYLALGGVPLGMAYKAVNTLDSMLGYKSERYLYFGRAAARLDDLANYLPARLTGLLLIVSALIIKLDWKGAWQTMVRDAGNHPSPNSGWPEAAVAGALGVTLGGENRYHGEISHRPLIGRGGWVSPGDITLAIRLMWVSGVLMVLLSSLVVLLW